MSLKELDQECISEIEIIVRNSISKKDSRTINSNDKLNIIGGALDMLIYQIVVPIITSICANSLYDYYKDGKLKSISIKKSKEIIEKCKNQPVGKKLEISEKLRSEMEEILENYGVDPEAIDVIVNKVNEHLNE